MLPGCVINEENIWVNAPVLPQATQRRVEYDNGSNRFLQIITHI